MDKRWALKGRPEAFIVENMPTAVWRVAAFWFPRMGEFPQHNSSPVSPQRRAVSWKGCVFHARGLKQAIHGWVWKAWERSWLKSCGNPMAFKSTSTKALPFLSEPQWGSGFQDNGGWILPGASFNLPRGRYESIPVELDAVLFSSSWIALAFVWPQAKQRVPLVEKF